jgi:hypothetical protein
MRKAQRGACPQRVHFGSRQRVVCAEMRLLSASRRVVGYEVANGHRPTRCPLSTRQRALAVLSRKHAGFDVPGQDQAIPAASRFAVKPQFARRMRTLTDHPPLGTLPVTAPRRNMTRRKSSSRLTGNPKRRAPCDRGLPLAVILTSYTRHRSPTRRSWLIVVPESAPADGQTDRPRGWPSGYS